MGARIKAARTKRRLSQTDLAKHLECTHQLISYWENDHVDPSTKQIAQLEEVLGVNFFLDPAGDGSIIFPQGLSKLIEIGLIAGTEVRLELQGDKVCVRFEMKNN